MNFLNNRNLLRGVFLMVVALIFGVGAQHYPLGSLSRAGPGMFPTIVSGVLFLIGLTIAARAFFNQPERMALQFRSIVIILVSLAGFAFISTYAGMLVATVFMTFCSAIAGVSYSWVRSAIISVCLIAIALVLQYGLGLNMPLMPPKF